MNFSCIIVLLCLIPTITHAQEVKYDKVGLRRLAVYLPEGYNESTQNFKTVYFYDGQASFGNHPYSWKIHEKLTSLISEGKIEKVVAVGIYTDVNRTEDLVPYYDPYIAENWGSYKPKGDKFDDFIIESLIPYIESKYKVQTESNSRALIGMSFAGLHAMYTGINHQKSFALVAGISASLWVNNYRFIKDLKKVNIGPKIWFDIGTAEWNSYTDAIDLLLDAGYEYGESLFYLEVSGAAHEAKYWIPRIEYPLILFAGATDNRISTFEIKIEVIPSATSKKHYLRINPIVTREDGVKYSLATQASYEVMNPGSGQVNEDGSFEFINNSDLKVRVSFQDWKEEIIILYSDIRARMKKD
jgi:enterochelin esterase-like enzyme